MMSQYTGKALKIMSQYTGKALQQTLNLFFKNPTGRRFVQKSAIIGIRHVSRNKEVQRQVSEGTQFVSERVQEIITSIRLKIYFRQKEVQVTLDLSRKYYVGKAHNSTVVQGEDITLIHQEVINKININVSQIDEKDITNLRELLKEIKSTESTFIKIIHNGQEIDYKNYEKEIDFLGEKARAYISKITDYDNLRKILGTN